MIPSAPPVPPQGLQEPEVPQVPQAAAPVPERSGVMPAAFMQPAPPPPTLPAARPVAPAAPPVDPRRLPPGFTWQSDPDVGPH
jgi:hypothetical protein